MQATVEVAAMDGQQPTQGRRTRTGKKRLRFEPPIQMPPGVKELWRASSSEAQAKAHQTCVEILAMWLGKKQSAEVARTLAIPPLRVWQLSQQALSGMLAGLLKQPRTRCRAEVSMKPNEDDPRVLKKKIAALEEANKRLEELLHLVKRLPQPGSNSPPGSSTPAAKTRARRAKAKAEGSGDKPPESPAAEAR